MDALFKIAKAVASEPQTGIIVLLVLLLGIAVWGYWQERKRNNKIQDERVIEAREDTKMMTHALHEATHAALDFKASNEALRLAFDALSRAIG